MPIPKILEKTPKPQEIDRHFGGKRLHVWYGRVHVDSIEGWVDNPRIELQRKRMKETIGDRPLTQDEVFELMKNDSSVKLKTLRDDILKNELKEPIILSKDGKLLDGNRRYFAVRLLLETMDKVDPNRRDYELIPCYVLNTSTSSEEEDMVLVETNFSPSLKQEWPDYVKSSCIRKELEKGLSPKEIATKYNWKRRQVEEVRRILKLIDDFCAFAEGETDLEDEFGGGLGLTETEAERIAADNYQFFNEAQKSFLKELESDINFKVAFYRWIAEKKFRSFPEVRIAHKAWKDPEARSVLMTDEPSAAKEAKAIIDYGERVIKGKTEAKKRIDEIIIFLEGLSSAEMEGLPSASIKKIEGALSLVAKMAKAAKK